MPSAAARPTLTLARGHWRSQRIGGGEDLWCIFFKRAGLSKVTRPSPQGGRNPVEGQALASCTAPAVPAVNTPSSPTLLPQGEKGAKTITGTGPSPTMEEGGKNDLGNRPLSRKGRREQDDHGNRPLSRKGRRAQRRSREQAPLPRWGEGGKGYLGDEEGQGEGIRAPPIWHTPSRATWRRRRRTGSAPGSAGRPLRS